MERGTFTLLNISRLGPGSTSGYGTYIGMKNARKAAIWFEGSYGLSGGTAAMLNVYGAIEPSPGSIDAAVIGSIVLAVGASNRTRRIKVFEGTPLEKYPFLVAKAKHQSGVASMGALRAKVILQ